MNQRIATRKVTIARRKAMSCRVYQLKVDTSHLSQSAIDHLDQLFLEAKWFYNYCLQDIKNADYNRKVIPVKVGDGIEDRELRSLGCHMRQDLKKRIQNAIKTLATLKSKGFKVGRLRFRKFVDSIPLREFVRTYRINFERKRFNFQGYKHWLRVRGLDQIPESVEFANATLIRKAGNYYLHVTTYEEKGNKEIPDCVIGIDFGCESQLTFDNGIKVKFQVSPTKRLKRLDRRIHRRGKAYTSKNKKKDQIKRQKEYARLANKRKDIRNKIVHAITLHYSTVCVQDENIAAWQASGHGKKVGYSGIGSILGDLKHKSLALLECDRSFPSTQTCPSCGNRKKLSLHERVHACDSCEFVLDRDVKSAISIKQECLRTLPADRREVTPGETATPAFFDALNKIHGIKVSKLPSWNREAARSSARR